MIAYKMLSHAKALEPIAREIHGPFIMMTPVDLESFEEGGQRLNSTLMKDLQAINSFGFLSHFQTQGRIII